MFRNYCTCGRGLCRHRTRNCQLVPGVDGDVDGDVDDDVDDAGRGGGGEAQPQPVEFDLTVLNGSSGTFPRKREN